MLSLDASAQHHVQHPLKHLIQLYLCPEYTLCRFRGWCLQCLRPTGATWESKITKNTCQGAARCLAIQLSGLACEQHCVARMYASWHFLDGQLRPEHPERAPILSTHPEHPSWGHPTCGRNIVASPHTALGKHSGGSTGNQSVRTYSERAPSLRRPTALGNSWLPRLL